MTTFPSGETTNTSLWASKFEGHEPTLTQVSSFEMDFLVDQAYLELVHAFPNPGLDALEYMIDNSHKYFNNPEAAFLPAHQKILEGFRWLDQELIYNGRPIGKKLVQHSMGVALMSHELATANTGWGIPMDADWAFTSGLLHDFGKIEIAKVHPHLLDTEYQYQNGDADIMAEHTKIGAEILYGLGSVDQSTIPAMVARLHHAYKAPDNSRIKANIELGELNAQAHQLLIVIAIADMVEATTSREYVDEDERVRYNLSNLDISQFRDDNISLPSDPFLRSTDIVGNYFNLIRARGSVCNQLYTARRRANGGPGRH